MFVTKVQQVTFEIRRIPLPKEKEAAWRTSLGWLVEACIEEILKESSPQIQKTEAIQESTPAVTGAD